MKNLLILLMIPVVALSCDKSEQGFTVNEAAVAVVTGAAITTIAGCSAGTAMGVVIGGCTPVVSVPVFIGYFALTGIKSGYDYLTSPADKLLSKEPVKREKEELAKIKANTAMYNAQVSAHEAQAQINKTHKVLSKQHRAALKLQTANLNRQLMEENTEQEFRHCLNANFHSGISSRCDSPARRLRMLNEQKADRLEALCKKQTHK